MAHPTRTGDVVAFSYPPYQFDAATPGTLVSLSHFFGQHGYVPDVQDLADNVNMRATFIAGGEGIVRGTPQVRSIDIAPTLAFLMRIPVPQHSQGRVLLPIIANNRSVKPLGIIGLNDFHGQLDPTTRVFDNALNATVGGAGVPGDHVRRGEGNLPAETRILAGGDNVGASPPNSGLLEDVPAIDVENAWPLDATSYGNHEFDYGLERLLMHQEHAELPVPGHQHRRDRHRRAAGLGAGHRRRVRVNGIKVGVIGSALETTPELVERRGHRGAHLPAVGARHRGGQSRRCRRQGINVQMVVIHEGTAVGSNAVDGMPPVAVGRADHGHRRRADRHHRRRHRRRAHPPGVQTYGRRHPRHRGHQRRCQLLGAAADGVGRRRHLGRRATRIAKNLGVAAAPGRPGDRRPGQRRHRGAPQPGDRHPGQRHPARPDQAARVGDGQHGHRRHAGQVPGDRRRPHQLRRAARRPGVHAAQRRRGRLRDHLGRGVRRAALREPHGDRHLHRRAAHRRLRERREPVLQRGDRHRAVPAGVGARPRVPLRRHDAGDRRDLARRRTAPAAC